MFKVTVSKLGSTLCGSNKDAAYALFNEYVASSKEEGTICSGQNVALHKDGELIASYVPLQVSKISPDESGMYRVEEEMKRPSYKEAIDWVVDNDDTEFLKEESPIPSVTTHLIADMFGATTEKVIKDLLATQKRRAKDR